MPQNILKIYVPAEYRDDITWAKTEFPDKPFNKTVLDLLREARTKAQSAKVSEPAAMTEDDRTEAETYYRRRFGFLKNDYKDDRDILETLGEPRTLSMLDTMFKQTAIERPEHYSHCIAQFRHEHPRLAKIREP